jgi:hypothetical protein
VLDQSVCHKQGNPRATARATYGEMKVVNKRSLRLIRVNWHILLERSDAHGSKVMLKPTKGNNIEHFLWENPVGLINLAS